MPDTTNINNLKSVIMNRISSEVDTVQDVSPYEKTNFKGFPAVTVACSGNENDYYSVSHNQRVFTFIIRIFVQIEKKPALDILSDNAKERAEQIMGRVISDIIDAFDTFYEFGDAADFLRAIPSAWGYAKIGEGWTRTAEIKLEVVKSYNVYS